jgi:hypothetical protein
MDTSIIPKLSVLRFLDDFYIDHSSGTVSLDAVIDINIPGRRKLCDSGVQFQLLHNYVILKLTNPALNNSFPTKFDSRNDHFTGKKNCCFCVEGYNCTGEFKLCIYPRSRLIDVLFKESKDQ